MTWSPPPAVRDAARRQVARYDDAGPWVGAAGCGGRLLPGAALLGAYLERSFPMLRADGYDCRPNTANTARTSIHGTGRALDAMIRPGTREGDAIANWLVAHATELGVQYLIWDQVQWNPNTVGEQFRPYGGPNPHVDHVHIELNEDGAAMRTAWFHNGGPERAPDAESFAWRDLVAPLVAGASALGLYLLWERR